MQTILPQATVDRINLLSEEVYSRLNELAQEQDSYDFGLPMFNKVNQPIIDALTAEATRALEREKVFVDALKWALYHIKECEKNHQINGSKIKITNGNLIAAIEEALANYAKGCTNE